LDLALAEAQRVKGMSAHQGVQAAHRAGNPCRRHNSQCGWVGWASLLRVKPGVFWIGVL
jgi:hypothetical protein